MEAVGEAAGARRGRWWIVAALGLALAALLAAIVELATEEEGGEKLVIDGVNDAQRIFGGLPQLGDRLGESDAAVRILLFNDVQCGGCEEQFLGTVPELVDGLVRSGDAKLLYRHYSFSPQVVQQGFIAAEAAGRQGYQWQYVYLFFRNQDEAERRGVTANFLESIAASVGAMEVSEWETDFAEGGGPDGAISEELERQDKAARELGIRAEPAAIVSGPGGTEVLQDSPSLGEIERAAREVG
jgi:protein-disulfide isomerase